MWPRRSPGGDGRPARLESAPGAGSAFHFTVPVERVVSAAEPSPTRRAHQRAFRWRGDPRGHQPSEDAESRKDESTSTSLPVGDNYSRRSRSGERDSTLKGRPPGANRNEQTTSDGEGQYHQGRASPRVASGPPSVDVYQTGSLPRLAANGTVRNLKSASVRTDARASACWPRGRPRRRRLPSRA